MKSPSERPGADERYSALLNNSAAIRAVASAVEGTLGPKGLDCMLVDRHGEVVVTNDGVTILERMDAVHPAARMAINVARAQQQEVGDGTTTATIMAATLVSEGVEQVLRGVPVSRVIEGVRFGLNHSLDALAGMTAPVAGVNDPVLEHVALVAGRGHGDIARLVAGAARMVGERGLKNPSFKLSDCVLLQDGPESGLFLGVIVERQRVSREMPLRVANARLLIVDDALEPEEVDVEALATEAGFARYMELRDQFLESLRRAVNLGVNVVMTDRGICDAAEEYLAGAGVMAVQRVANSELRRVAQHVGAKMLKRTGLKKTPEEMADCLGTAGEVYEDERLRHIRILEGKGEPLPTILIGAATSEMGGERARMARDAADSLQSAYRGGVVPGGGAAELAAMRRLAERRNTAGGMAVYGVDSVIAALRRPLAQIAANSGFNALEKVEQVIAAQEQCGSDSLGLNCDTGEIADMGYLGILDPAPVKMYALKAAGELAESILRINVIMRQRDDGAGMAGEPGGS